MAVLKRYLITNFEAIFCLVILVSIVSINYFIPYKLVFLNFYFLVVALATYYLEVHRALLGGILCTLIVIVYVYLFPDSFMPDFTRLDLWMNIVVWFSFLILTGAVVGQLSNRLKNKVDQLKELTQDLEDTKAKLTRVNEHLRRYATRLEVLVTSMTDSK